MCHAAGAWMDIMDFNETLGKLFLLVKLGRNDGYGQKIMTQYFFLVVIPLLNFKFLKIYV